MREIKVVTKHLILLKKHYLLLETMKAPVRSKAKHASWRCRLAYKWAL